MKLLSEAFSENSLQRFDDRIVLKEGKNLLLSFMNIDCIETN